MTTISQNHALVCIEDLQVCNMSRSALGTTGNAGKHVRAKSGLNKANLDQDWFEFRRQLDYKPAWNGGWPLPCRRTTQPAPAHTAAICRRTIGRRKTDSNAWNAASKEAPMWLAR